jgi:SagB-type dehydrogenase family enzyme
LENISKFLELALGLAAVKRAGGSTWTVRMNPSSGNLHPTECYLVIPNLGGLNGVFHYNPYLHALEKIRDLPPQGARIIKEHYKTGGLLLILTSIPWRESWKYGERALRYCLLDAGHAVGSIRFSANLRGWRVKHLNGTGDKELIKLLGFDKVPFPEGEEEYPELALFVFPQAAGDVPRDIPTELVKLLKKAPILGRPSILSPQRVLWKLVYETLEAIEKPETAPRKFFYKNPPPRFLLKPAIPVAERVIRLRRSGHIYDPEAYISKEAFWQILDRTLSRNDFSPFDVEISPDYTTLIGSVHRVEGIPKGLYAFVRNPQLLRLLKKRLSPAFLWKRVDDRLYLLAEGDFSKEFGYLSCMQDIASDGAFALSMLALFEPVIERAPWEYRTLHYEAGLVGQALYVEATALGLKGTGIGCFFDDLIHEFLGLAKVERPFGLEPEGIEVDRTFQVVYNFTVGVAYEDPRIETFEPYLHLKR